MITNAKPTIGTLIHGTLREEDLLEAFASELERLEPSHTLVNEYHGYVDTNTVNEIEHDLVQELHDALNEYAPAHTYFGTLEGDGSDFGFWGDLESLEMCDTVATETPSYLRGDSEVWDKDCQVYVHINDHGNVTVSDINHDEIWSAV